LACAENKVIGDADKNLKIGNGTVTFGHGGRHIAGMDVSFAEQTIAKNVPKLNVGENYIGNININGMKIEYHAFGRPERVINIGTYFIK